MCHHKKAGAKWWYTHGTNSEKINQKKSKINGVFPLSVPPPIKSG